LFYNAAIAAKTTPTAPRSGPAENAEPAPFTVEEVLVLALLVPVLLVESVGETGVDPFPDAEPVPAPDEGKLDPVAVTPADSLPVGVADGLETEGTP